MPVFARESEIPVSYTPKSNCAHVCSIISPRLVSRSCLKSPLAFHSLFAFHHRFGYHSASIRSSRLVSIALSLLPLALLTSQRCIFHAQEPIDSPPSAGLSLIPSMPFNSENSRRYRAKRAGLARAKFWRGLGFANLVLARLALANKRASRLNSQSSSGWSPFAIPDDLPNKR